MATSVATTIENELVTERSKVVVVAVLVVAAFVVVVVIDVVVVISSAHIKLLPEVPQVILFGQVYSETKSLTARSFPCDPGVSLITQCPFGPCHIHHINSPLSD